MKLFKKYSFRNKLPRSLDLRKSDQSGQAMIEYVLVVIISVTMLFMAKGVFSSLNNYISGYVGGYFKCLMTQGELPALGVSDTQLSRHTGGSYKCSAKYEKATIGGADGGATKTSGTTAQLSSEKAKGSTKETAASRGGASSSPSSSSKKSAASKRKGGRGSAGETDDTKFSSNVHNRSEAYSSSDADGDDSVRSTPINRSGFESGSSKPYRAVSGEMDAAIKKQTRGGGLAARDKSERKIILPEDDARPGPRRTKFNPHVRSVAAVDEEAQEDMGFGYFMKWIMIAGIGLALFVFFGGQVMNYNNSDGG